MTFRDSNHNVPHPMISFEPATADDFKKIILSSQDKACDLDPLPAKLLKYCLDVLLTPITNIFHLSCNTTSHQVISQQTQNFCKTFVQRWPNVFDVGPTLYKCYTNVCVCWVGDNNNFNPCTAMSDHIPSPQ